MPAMNAVANGEHLEAFSSAKNGAPLDTDLDNAAGNKSDSQIIEGPSELAESTEESCTNESYSGAFAGKKIQINLYNKPCPKSKKVKESVSSTDKSNEKIDVDVSKQTKNDLEFKGQDNVTVSPEPDPEPTPNLPETEADIPENIEEEASILVPEELEGKDVLNESKIDKDSVEGVEEDWHWDATNATTNECDIEESTDEPVNGTDNQNGLTGSEHGNEGIVTEPEDHIDKLDQESSNIPDADVTISFLDFEESSEEEHSKAGCDNETDAIPATELPEANDPLIEFPVDSPPEASKSVHLDDPVDSEASDDIETEVLTGNDSMKEVPKNSSEMAYKILHHVDNPTYHTNIKPAAKDFKDEDNTMGQLSQQEAYKTSFGKSLRSLSGRRAMRPLASDSKHDDIATSTETSHPSFFAFSFGKRKAEDIPKEPETNKRVKTDEGVDSLGFFARLTSPVINRLRGIRVGSPEQTSSHAGEEVSGHEEKAVALFNPPPASKRCILM